MGHTMKWGTLLPKRPCLWLSQLLVLAGLFHFCSGITPKSVTKRVKETVVLSCDYNTTTEELASLRIYWQKDSKMVLAILLGKVQVWSEYENRTITDINNNPRIVILALRLSDSGTYTCVIQKPDLKGTYKVEHLTSVKLMIRADFPVPTINDLGNPSPNIRRVICSTSGGFPRPYLSWLENGEELNATNTTLSQDPETKLYTISSELDFNMTSNHSFLCLVKYGDLTVSQTFYWQESKPTPSTNQHLPWTIIIPVSACGISVIIAVMLACLTCRNAARCRRRRRNENMEMQRWSVSIKSVEG